MKKIIKTNNAPAPIGPYNQAVMVKDTLYVSGQIGLNPSTMELAEGGVIAEAEQVMLNLKAVLEENDVKQVKGVGHGSMIGANVTLMPNTSIGNNCVIGACSQVRDDVPDNEIWFGNPAKPYKKK